LRNADQHKAVEMPGVPGRCRHSARMTREKPGGLVVAFPKLSARPQIRAGVRALRKRQIPPGVRGTPRWDGT